MKAVIGLTENEIASYDRQQLVGSIDKLFHYLFSYVRFDTVADVYDGERFIAQYRHSGARKVSLSSTLYTRIDDCFGAGNCCRIPFALVYTDYDRARIYRYDFVHHEKLFGTESAKRFSVNANLLLDRLVPLKVIVKQDIGAEQSLWATRLWVQRNTEINPLSGAKSCPYLFVGEDRYFCGAHPFKPLHCWYPHMTVRVDDKFSHDGTSVTIGRMQYGRNHKFGCPVIFGDVADEGITLFGDDTRESYFDKQFESDYGKLDWTSESAKSLGFTEHNNVVVGLHDVFAGKRSQIETAINERDQADIPLWRR